MANEQRRGCYLRLLGLYIHRLRSPSGYSMWHW